MTAIDPSRLASGRWWAERGSQPWPDALLAGLLEPLRGYRFRPENLALPLLLGEGPVERVVDLGAGTGSLLLIAAYFANPRRCVGLERQPAAVERLRRTLGAHRGVDARLVEGDLRRSEARDRVLEALGKKADRVVMNPPYFAKGWGRPSAQESTRLSTHGEHGDVSDFLDAAVALLERSGRVLVVFDAGRLSRLLRAAAGRGLSPRRLLFIDDQRPDRDEDPFRVWVELVSAPDEGCAVDWLDRRS